jgi:hypothetical protein
VSKNSSKERKETLLAITIWGWKWTHAAEKSKRKGVGRLTEAERVFFFVFVDTIVVNFKFFKIHATIPHQRRFQTLKIFSF